MLLLDGSTQRINPFGHVAYFVDNAGIQSPEALIARGVPFTTTGPELEALVLRTAEHPLWMRLRLQNTSDRQIEAIAEMDYVPMDYWDVFIPDDQGFQHIALGDKRPFENRAFNVGSYNNRILLAPGEEKTIYFHAKTDGRLIVPLRIYTGDAFYNETIKRVGYFRLFIGIAGGLFLFSLMLGIQTKEKVYLIYSLLVFMRFLQLFIAEGSIHGWLETLNFFEETSLVTFSALYTASALWFHSAFLQFDKYYPKVNQAINATAILICVLGLPVALLSYAFASTVIQLAVLLVNPFFIASAVYCIYKGFAPARIYLAALFLPIVATFWVLLSYAGVIPYKDNQSYWVGAAFSTSLILFSIALASRINMLNTEKSRAESLAMGAKIEAKAKSDFLAQMSHEIRTPMNGVLGVSQLLAQTVLTETQKKYNQIIHSSGKLLLQVIDDVLDFSKLEAGKMTIETIDFDPRALCEETKSTFLAKTLEKDIRFRVEIDEQVPAALRGDPTRIKQVLYNLINNACKFTDKGVITLSINTTGTPDEYRFSVSDSGVGIPAKLLNKLFMPYRQADSSVSRQYGGTGLGLSICKQLCELMGGQIGVESVEHEGSTFWFILPLPRGDAEAQTSDADAGDDKNLPPAAGRSLHVLIAEDNTVNQLVVQGMLTTLGHTHETVENGEEAVKLFEKQGERFDLVLMDCEMPVLDGRAAARKIRQLAPEGSIPIVALTAHAMKEQLDDCRQAGMNGHLTKPLKLEALRSVCLACQSA